jgi:hypothetical protein
MEITDNNGRTGIVTDDRGDVLFAVPLGSRGTIDGIHPGVGRAKYMTATAWHKQPDGSYRGIWFDDPPMHDRSHVATVTGDAKDRLQRCGSALYGDRWQSDLARALGVGDRRVREWLSGARRIPVGVWPDIADLLQQRQAECAALAREIAG